MKGETIFVLAVMTAVISSVANIGTSAYGGQTGYGTEPPPELDDETEGGLLSGLADAVAGGIRDILNTFIPEPTGIWVIDNWIINPLLAVSVYWLIAFARGI